MKHIRARHIGYGLLLVATLGIGYVLLTIVAAEGRLLIGGYQAWNEQPFYALPEPLPEGKPGQIIRTQRLASTPEGMNGWRILYYSTDLKGERIVVSGLVASPQVPAKDGQRTVVSWAHPTTGTAQNCAPSVGIDPFDSIEGLRDLVHAGYVVVATDYAGMGAAGPASFLIGDQEGRNVLDAARAVRQMPQTDAGADVVLWGHSQGGHASLFADQLAPAYTPELHIKGVAVAAPATDLGQLLEADGDDVSGVTIGSYAMDAYAKAYDADIDTILTPNGVAATSEMANLCLLGQNAKLHEIAKPLLGNYFQMPPTTKQPWATILDENSAGKAKARTPLFVAQGEIDTLVKPAITDQFVANQRQLGAVVTYKPLADTGHALVADRAMPALMDWMRGLD